MLFTYVQYTMCNERVTRQKANNIKENGRRKL